MKLVQISTGAAVTVPDQYGHCMTVLRTVALDEEGHAWELDKTSLGSWEWRRLPDLPTAAESRLVD